MTRAFIAAPTPMVRAGLRAMLEAGDVEVAGEAPSIADIQTDLQAVDVLVLASEEMLPAARDVIRDGEIALVLLSESDRAAAQLRSMPLRAWGIVSPDAPATELQAAVHSAAQGLVVLSLPLAERLFSAPTPVQALDAAATADEKLTLRELEVLQLVSQGLPNKIIARRLQISEHTVKFHVSSIYTKLGASSRTDAVNRAARLGLIAF